MQTNLFTFVSLVLMSVNPPTSTFQGQQPSEKPLMALAIENILVRLPGQIVGIEAEALNDDDLNYKLIFEIKSGEKEKASLFALKLNGKPKDPESIVKELIEKVKNHLLNKEHPDVIKLSSGNMIFSETTIPIKEEDGYLCVDGKKVVIEKKGEGTYMPLPGLMVQTYTSSRFFQENELVILLDHHESIRDDGKEGFIFNLRKGIKLQRAQLVPHPKDENADRLPNEGEYLVLYRTREDARKTS